jgi:hypothetical protein
MIEYNALRYTQIPEYSSATAIAEPLSCHHGDQLMRTTTVSLGGLELCVSIRIYIATVQDKTWLYIYCIFCKSTKEHDLDATPFILKNNFTEC